MMKNITLIIKPTHKCNLNCPYCYDQHNRKNNKYSTSSGMMSLDTVSKISNIFKDRASSWIWHGGEPLMIGTEFYYKANDIIKKVFGNDFSINMQTNGTLIDEKVIEMFKKYNIRPGLSFDGLKNENSRKNTARLMYVFSLLKKNNIDFGSIMVMTSKNINNIIGEYEYSKVLDIPFQMNPIFETKDNNSTNILSDIMIKHICNFFDYWIRDMNNPVESELCISYLGRLIGSHRTVCNYINCVGKWFAIHPDGTIHPCGRDWGDDMVFGNIHEIDCIEDIYMHPNFKKFKIETKELLDKCSDCVFFNLCKCGCFGDTYHHSKLKEVETNYCKSTKEIFTHIFNQIKNIDTNRDYDEYNPIFINYLIFNGFRNINFIKKLEEVVHNC